MPILDAVSGELIGLHYSVRPGVGAFDLTHHDALDLDPATPDQLVLDAALPVYASATIGGRFLHIEPAQGPNGVLATDAFWCTGGRADIGATMTVSMFAPWGSGPHLSVLAAASSFAAVGASVPGALGQFGLGPTLWVSTPQLHDPQNGEGRVSITVPNVPALRGARIPCQAGTLEVPAGTVHLGNTALLRVE